MDTVRVEITVANDGTIILKDLPFHAGDQVEVTIRNQTPPEKSGDLYPLRGKPVHYKNPFDSVAEEDWETLR